MSEVKEIHIQDKSLNPTRNRKETLNILEQLCEKGFRYVVRDKEMNYLVCFSSKPQKYQDTESWGYVNPDAQGIMGAYPVKNVDITEINWTNRSASLIS